MHPEVEENLTATEVNSLYSELDKVKTELAELRKIAEIYKPKSSKLDYRVSLIQIIPESQRSDINANFRLSSLD